MWTLVGPALDGCDSHAQLKADASLNISSLGQQVSGFVLEAPLLSGKGVTGMHQVCILHRCY